MTTTAAYEPLDKYEKQVVEKIRYKRDHPPLREGTWDAFCERHNLRYGYGYSKSEWTRKHFKIMLDTMPHDHPDRWLYQTGAKFSPHHAIGKNAEIWDVTVWVIKIWGSFLAGLITLVFGCTMWLPLITVPIVLSVFWSVVLIRRYMALAR